jgi:hypothetical protein
MYVNLILVIQMLSLDNDSVMYDTYDPLVLQTRMIIESEMKENNDGLKTF